MLPRLLVIALVLSIGYFTVKSLFARPRRPAPGPESAAGPDDAEDMVRCAACGVYLSEQAALSSEGRGRTQYFCNEACRAKEASPPPA